MQTTTLKRALISVYDKTGLVEISQVLQKHGYEIVSTGGSYKKLQEAGIKVTQVSNVTNFPEILGGRVKTLHPMIHGGILAKRTPEHIAELQKYSITPIDVVICNLYPFVETLTKGGVTEADIIEEIDIGGVTLLRAAAKNFESVTVISDPKDYHLLTEGLIQGITRDERKKFALKAFRHTATYDAAIATWLTDSAEPLHTDLPNEFNLSLKRIQALRYGENPHQKGALYKWSDSNYPFEQLQGKELSYNNILDIESAWHVCLDFSEVPCCAIIKHNTPCGIATHEKSLVEAFKAALECDSISAFGSIIAVNREVDLTLVKTIGKLFLEVLVASHYTSEALEWLAKEKKNCRVMITKGSFKPELVYRSVFGGCLVQTADITGVNFTQWKVVSQKQPTEQQRNALAFAWIAVKHVKSNAIVLVQGTATVGIGCGQTNRVDSVRLATQSAREKAKGSVMGSDAFFPFPDGVEEAAKAGVLAVVQPGGSVKDNEVIAAADRLGLVMIFTGERHFRH